MSAHRRRRGLKPLHLGISFNLTGGKVISQPLLGVSLDFMNDRRFPVSPHTDLAPPSPHHPAVVGFRVLPLKFCVHAGVLPSLPRRLPAGVLETVVFLPPLLCLTRVQHPLYTAYTKYMHFFVGIR